MIGDCGPEVYAHHYLSLEENEEFEGIQQSIKGGVVTYAAFVAAGMISFGNYLICEFTLDMPYEALLRLLTTVSLFAYSFIGAMQGYLSEEPILPSAIFTTAYGLFAIWLSNVLAAYLD